MDFSNQEQLISKSRKEYQRLQSADQQVRSLFYRKAMIGGLLAGVLTLLFMGFGGFYITGDQAVVGFAKYIILAAVLGILLYQLKIASPEGQTFKRGIVIGMLASAVAAITTAVGSILVNSIGQGDAVTIYPYFQAANNEVISTFTLAGVSLFEGLVAGMILTFIWLQILKDRSRAK